jgi:hypothetical protein
MQNSGQKPHPTDAELFHSNVKKLIGSRHFTVADLKAKSPVPIPDDPTAQFQLALSSLFSPEECIELKASVLLDDQPKGAPVGNTVRRTVSEWLRLTHQGEQDLLLGSRCGTHMRINPVESGRPGSGLNGHTTDNDIASYRFCLIEHDELPKDEQAALLAILPLPVAAVIDSGAQSLHAWLKIGASWGGGFAEEVKPLYAYLKVLGFDPANKNPSRLTRAPGFPRLDRAGGSGFQALLYLNTNPTITTIAPELA